MIIFLVYYFAIHPQQRSHQNWARHGNFLWYRPANGPGQPEMDWIRGAIKVSFSVNGYFGACEYLNWVCKFFIDSNLFESEIRARESKICEIN
jgi:hypothetical protein